MPDGESSFPRQFISAGVTYERAIGQHALRFDDHPREGEPSAGALPVYRKTDDGALVIASGRSFVRLAEGRRIEELAEPLRAAGYAIDTAPPWAPHAAWLKASSPAAGLTGLARLAGIAGVEHVEPELLRPRAHK